MTIIAKPVFLLALLALLVAAGLAGGPSSSFDVAIISAAGSLRSAHLQLTGIAGGLTNLGGAYATLGLTAAASFWLVIRRMPGRALLLAATVLCERSLVELLKAWVGRPRPHFEVDWLAESLAFPSGHSANSMTAFLAVALIAASPELRRTSAIAALAVSVLVGLTRIWLGVHWPSDVIGGWAFGLLAVGTAVMIGERLGAIEPQHQVVGRHRPPLGEDEAA